MQPPETSRDWRSTGSRTTTTIPDLYNATVHDHHAHHGRLGRQPVLRLPGQRRSRGPHQAAWLGSGRMGSEAGFPRPRPRATPACKRWRTTVPRLSASTDRRCTSPSITSMALPTVRPATWWPSTARPWHAMARSASRMWLTRPTMRSSSTTQPPRRPSGPMATSTTASWRIRSPRPTTGAGCCTSMRT